EAMELVLADQSTLNPSGIIKEVLVKVKDLCFKIDVRERPQNVPQAGGWKMKIQLDELEEDMSQLTMEEEPLSPDLIHQMKLLNIKEENKALWVRRWGKNRKIIDKDSRSEKWINIPREVKEVKSKRKTLFKGDPPREWDICYAFYKEQQMHDEKSEALLKARKEIKPTYPP
ncbi:hypothetical protein A2U01_0030309, partial [Trifolium medium]|nr:hypothetical protein [Trifolium medium]